MGNWRAETAEPDNPSVVTSAEHSESHVNVNIAGRYLLLRLDAVLLWAAAAASSHMVHDLHVRAIEDREAQSQRRWTEQFETDSRGSWAGRASASFTGGSNRAATAKSSAHCGGGAGRRSVLAGT